MTSFGNIRNLHQVEVKILLFSTLKKRYLSPDPSQLGGKGLWTLCVTIKSGKDMSREQLIAAKSIVRPLNHPNHYQGAEQHIKLVTEALMLGAKHAKNEMT